MIFVTGNEDLPLATQRRVEAISSDRSPFAVASPHLSAWSVVSYFLRYFSSTSTEQISPDSAGPFTSFDPVGFAIFATHAFRHQWAKTSEQFYTDATRHSDLDLSLASFFPTGGEFIMSMHQYMPDQAVLVDSWTLFCPECAQKMRIIMAAPAQDGKETRTFEFVSGHREWMTVALH